jgi:hypothetical protein
MSNVDALRVQFEPCRDDDLLHEASLRDCARCKQSNHTSTLIWSQLSRNTASTGAYHPAK